MADTQPYRPRKRGFETAKDMLWSLVPIIVLVLGFVYFCGPRDDQTTSVDPQPNIEGAAQVVDYPLVAPKLTGDAWTPVSSALLREDDAITGLSIGYLNDDEKMARYVISSGSREDVLDTALGNASVVDDPDGESTPLGDLSWTPVSTTSGRALVAEGNGYVAVVAGDASYSQLREIAGSVRAAKG